MIQIRLKKQDVDSFIRKN